MKIHELKLDTEFFDDVKLGKKNFEIRKNHRNFEVGDTLHLFASGSCCNYCDGVSYKRFYKGNCSGWSNVYKNEADCLKAKVLAIYSAEQINPDLDIVNSKNYVANLHVVFFLKDVSNVLKNYFQANKLPEEYVVMVIEVFE